MIWNYVF